MLRGFLIVLMFSIIIFMSLLIITLLKRYFEFKTQLNQILIVAFACFGFGIYFECYRILNFIFFDPIDDFVYRFFFIITTFLIFFGICQALQGVLIFNRQSGHEIQKGTFIIYLYLSITVIISILNVYMVYKTEINELGFYTYQLHPILIILSIILQFSLFIFIFIKTRTYLQEIKTKKLIHQLILFLFFFAALSIERCCNLGYFWIFPHSIYIYLVDILILTMLLGCSLILLLRNPEFLEAITTYFCVKSINLIKKGSAQMIYGFDFQKEDSKAALTPNRLLLGGLIHAVSTGFGQTLQTSDKIDTLKFGENSILFKHGKYIYGILFVTEHNPIVHLKLLLLMERFEHHYEDVLKNWTGELSQFKSEIITKWIYEIFR